MDLLRFLLRLPFTLIKGLCWVVCKFFWLIGRIFRPVVGNIEWRAPGWAVKSVRGVKSGFGRLEHGVERHPKSVGAAVLLLVLLAVGGFYGYHVWLNRPQPIEPAPLVYQETTLRVSGPQLINYNTNSRLPQEIALNFRNSVAPITLVGKNVDQGISLSPAVDGQWQWRNASTLVFTPKAPLPMGATYKIKLDPAKLLAPQSKITQTEYDVNVPAFDYQLGQAEYYQDPQDPKKRSAIFRVQFNAPVDVASFEKQISLGLTEGKETPEKKLNYSLVYDEKKLNAWVHSEALQALDHGGSVHIAIGKGVKSTAASQPTSTVKNNWVAVPTLYSLAVKDVSATVVDANDNKGERALIVALSDAVKDKEIGGAVKAWLLPEKNPKDSDNNDDDTDAVYPWDMSEIDTGIINQSTPVKLTLNDAEQEYQPQFSFKFDAPAKRYMLVEIANTLTSFGGYKMPEKRYQLVVVPDYPTSLSFMSQGSLLSMSGEKQISVAARNVPGLKLDIKRVIPSQLQHIVSFKSSDYSSAQFNRLSDEYFTEHFEYTSAVNNEKPGEVSYQGIDLSRYLSDT